MMNVLSGSVGKGAGICYAFLCLLLAFTMGGALQSGAVVELSAHFLPFPGFYASLVFPLTVLPVLVGGIRKIETVSNIIIPMSTIIYIIMCILIIVRNRGDIFDFLYCSFMDAFTPSSCAVGVLTGGVFRCAREGFSAGMLSNEAGAGTSAMAESRGSGSDPASAGLLGICEVLFDTTLLCTLTGLAIGVSTDSYTSVGGIELVKKAFLSLGPKAPYLLLPLLFTFAFSG